MVLKFIIEARLRGLARDLHHPQRPPRLSGRRRLHAAQPRPPPGHLPQVRDHPRRGHRRSCPAARISRRSRPRSSICSPASAMRRRRRDRRRIRVKWLPRTRAGWFFRRVRSEPNLAVGIGGRSCTPSARKRSTRLPGSSAAAPCSATAIGGECDRFETRYADVSRRQALRADGQRHLRARRRR